MDTVPLKSGQVRKSGYVYLVAWDDYKKRYHKIFFLHRDKALFSLVSIEADENDELIADVSDAFKKLEQIFLLGEV